MAYDGTNYHGWQMQPNGVTIEEVLNYHLSELLKEPIRIIGASRTDAGVHALCQKVMFDTETTIPPEKICLALQKFLPKSIEIIKSEEVNKDFNVRFDVSDKTYEYHIYNNENKNPLYRNYSEYVKNPLDINLMNKACKYFLGEHDFTMLRSAGSEVSSTVRNVSMAKISRCGDLAVFEVTADGFLYNMVRKMAAALKAIGEGKADKKRLLRIVDAKESFSLVAPPCGLYLWEVKYE